MTADSPLQPGVSRSTDMTISPSIRALVASIGFVGVAYYFSVAVPPGAVLPLSTESTGTIQPNVFFETDYSNSAEAFYTLRVEHSRRNLVLALGGGIALFAILMRRARKSRITPDLHEVPVPQSDSNSGSR